MGYCRERKCWLPRAPHSNESKANSCGSVWQIICKGKREKLCSVVEPIDRFVLGISNGFKNVSSAIQRFPI